MERVYSFIGDFASRADAKNRVVLPSAFKRELESEGNECAQPTETQEGAKGGARLVIKKDLFEQCLIIYPYSVWEKMMSDLRGRIDPYNRRHAQFLREFQRNTSEVALDGNGRILIPQRLLDLIGAGKELTFLGIDDHIELWNTETYDNQALSGEALGELADSIFGNEGDK